MTLDLFTKTTGARAAVAHVNKGKELTGATLGVNSRPWLRGDVQEATYAVQQIRYS